MTAQSALIFPESLLCTNETNQLRLESVSHSSLILSLGRADGGKNGEIVGKQKSMEGGLPTKPNACCLFLG